MSNKKELAYIGIRVTRNDYWLIKNKLAKRKEKLQDAVIKALNNYLEINISSPNK